MNLIVRIVVVLVQFAVGGAAWAAMPLSSNSSQPVGHYDFCKKYADRCGRNALAGLLMFSNEVEMKLDAVNRSVNEAIEPVTDEDNYGTAEYWTYPKTKGDCEDYALLKQYMLERAGLPRSALLMTVLRQRNGEGHAVLTVVTDRGDFVLDNLEEDVRDWTKTDYVYLKRQSAADWSKWIAITDQRDLPVASVR